MHVLISAVQAGAQGLASPVNAGYLNVNVGAQPQRRTIRTADSFSLYDETATVTSSQPIKNGPMFDVSGGYRVTRRFVIAVGVSSFRSSSTSTITASIPDPSVFDRPKTVTQDTSDLGRTEVGVHMQAVWFIPVTDKIDVALSAGPSFIRVTQELTPTVTVPARTQNISASEESQSGTALGVNVGFDGTYMLTPRYGAGVFLRFAGGSVDLPAVADLKVGGFQGGFGFRVRF